MAAMTDVVGGGYQGSDVAAKGFDALAVLVKDENPGDANGAETGS